MDKKEKTKIAIDILLSLNDGDCVYVDKELLKIIKDSLNALEYRNPLTVTEFVIYPSGLGGNCPAFEICPKCGNPLSRSYQEFCAICGQRLRWINHNKMKLKPPTNNSN